MAEVVPDDGARFYEIESLWTAYPWDDWLNGQTWLLSKATDFPLFSVVKFRNKCKYVARSRQLAIRTKIEGDGLYIQAYKPAT